MAVPPRRAAERILTFLEAPVAAFSARIYYRVTARALFQLATAASIRVCHLCGPGHRAALPLSNIVSRRCALSCQLFFQLLHTLAQLFEFIAHLRQTTEVSVQSFVFIERLNGNAPPDAGPHDLAGQHAGL